LDGFIEATIVTNLVPLALRSDDSILLEVVRSFTAISKSSDPENPKHTSSVVIAAQTTLARGLQGRGAVTQQVLGEYLALFAERGSHIQSHYPTGGHRDKEKDLEKDPETQARIGNEMSHLAALLYPIDAVMSVPDWCSQVNRSHAFVTLFRNMWFLCALFGFTRADSTYVDDSARQALKRIASRTPALLLETERDYVASSLEYNSILRRNYAAAVRAKWRGRR
jgi:phosphatidylinositol 4-kinase